MVELESAGRVKVVSGMLAVMGELTRRLDLAVLAKRVLGLRTSRNLGQEELATLADVSPAYISRLERGVVPNPKVFDLDKVAQAFKVPLYELLKPPGEDPPPWSLEQHLSEQGVIEWLIFDALEAGHGEPEAIQRVLALQTVSINRRLRALSDGQTPVNPQEDPDQRRHA